MLEKLKQVEARYAEIEAKLSDPAWYSDSEQIQKLYREQRELQSVAETYRAYQRAEADLEQAKALLGDPELGDMAKEELADAKERLSKLEQELRILLLPKDPNDDKNVILEIRGGVGGEESALFAHSLFRMYSMYAERRGWKISTVTVAVLPEQDEVSFQLDPKDLQIDTYRSSGAGGQHVNKTESAIRITHLPTGTVVECQDERSQYKNKERAMKILASRLYAAEQEKQATAIAAERRSQVGTGMRNERIRTYNFPQGRVTDHRIGLTLYKIDQIMNGDLDEIMDGLITADQAEKLKASAEEV